MLGQYVTNAGELILLSLPNPPTMKIVGVYIFNCSLVRWLRSMIYTGCQYFPGEIQFQLLTVVIRFPEKADFTDYLPFLVPLPHSPASGFLSCQINLSSFPCHRIYSDKPKMISYEVLYSDVYVCIDDNVKYWILGRWN